MPLTKSMSDQQLWDEVRHGKTFSQTARKFGKARAEKQMQAIVLSTKRKFGRGGKRAPARREPSRASRG